MSAHSTGPPPLAAKFVMYLFQALTVTLAGIVAATVITNVWWRLTPSNELDILVYDQTVPDETYPEHAVLGQIFEYHRVPYDVSTDYVGTAPGGGPYGTWPTEQPDVIILADTYGVYVNEQGEADDLGSQFASGRFSIDQANDVARWIDAGTPAYAEFSLVTEPTPESAALVLEDTFGFVSTGWVMHAVEDLADLSPGIQALGPFPWTYSGPGFIAIHAEAAGRPSTRKLVVLTEDMMTSQFPDVVGGPPGSAGGSASFSKWFSFVTPKIGTTVDAWFELPVTEEGAAVLEAAGIPARIPAMIRTERTLYFAGDGLEDETPFRLRRLKGGAVLTRLVTGKEFSFLYQVLEPSMKWLIDHVPDGDSSDVSGAGSDEESNAPPQDD